MSVKFSVGSLRRAVCQVELGRVIEHSQLIVGGGGGPVKPVTRTEVVFIVALVEVDHSAGLLGGVVFGRTETPVQCLIDEGEVGLLAVFGGVGIVSDEGASIAGLEVLEEGIYLGGVLGHLGI